MHAYKEIQGVLLKKYRILWAYIFILQSDNLKTRVCVGKMIYLRAEIGSRWTVGYMGKKLINIRPGVGLGSDE